MNRKIDRKKYGDVILYLCQGLGGAIAGKKKLAKLLYYVDFDHFEYKESMRSITGDKYQAWKMGPVPERYMEIIGALEKDGKIERKLQKNANPDIKPTEVFVAKAPADESIFTADERYILNRVIKNYGKLTGKQLEDLTHSEAPYIATERNNEIEYELAFYRGTEFEDDKLATA